MAFGLARPGEPTFVDEYDLAKRLGRDLKDASPDQAVLWEDRVLVIEMKTEGGSHSAGQCEWYLNLAQHHNPGRQVDLIYLTGPMPPWSSSATPTRGKAAHLMWDAVDQLVAETWDGSP